MIDGGFWAAKQMKVKKSKSIILFIGLCLLSLIVSLALLIQPKSKSFRDHPPGHVQVNESASNRQATFSSPIENTAPRTSEKLGKESNISIDAAASKRIDESINIFLTADLCDDSRLNKKVTTRDLISYKKSNGNDYDKVIDASERQLRSLCSSTSSSTSRNLTDSLDVTTDLSTYVLENSSLLQEVNAFIDIIHEDKAKGQESASTDKIHEFVRSKIQQSTGLHELMEIVAALNDSGVLGPALSDFGYPDRIQREDAAAAGMVAACEIFGGCEAISALSVSLCFLVCERPMTAVEYALSSVPALRLNAVERAAAAIVAARSARSRK